MPGCELNPGRAWQYGQAIQLAIGRASAPDRRLRVAAESVDRTESLFPIGINDRILRAGELSERCDFAASVGWSG